MQPYNSPEWRNEGIFARPYLWEKNVTVCIAAACLAEGKARIVLCSDWLASSGIGSAETHLKKHQLADTWWSLESGTSYEINALRKRLTESFVSAQSSTGIGDNNIIDIVKTPLHQRKEEKIDDYVRRRFAISYGDFLEHGKERLPETQFRGAFADISGISLNAEFVIAGFVDGRAWLIETDQFGEVKIRDDFATVGEGAILAQAALLQREHIDVRSVEETVYCVYEAKKYAEKVRSVGGITGLSIVSFDGNEKRFSFGEGMKFLDKKYAEFGPRPVQKFAFTDDLFR